MNSAPDQSSIRVGTILDEKYEVLSRLGVGGMGEVFKARHVHLNTIRCVKVMRQDLAGDASLRERFLREAIAATRVQHPNVATVHDFSRLPDGSHYMVSEFIDGLTLRQWVAENGRFPLPLAVEIAIEVLAGLQHCHERGLVHRDVSADNIMIATDSRGETVVKIIDLGIAKVVAAGGAADATREGLFIGNPKYSSPEQLGTLEGGEVIDGRSDLYSLGVVLYEMVAGVAPFVADTPHGYAAKHLMQTPPAFNALADPVAVPAAFEAIVRKALEKNRRQRFASAQEFADALRPFSTTIPLGTLMTLPAAAMEDASRAITERLTPADAVTRRDDSLHDLPTVIDPSTASRRRRRASMLVAAAAVVVVILAAIFVPKWIVPATKPAPVTRRTTAVAAQGIVVVNALPWAEVTSVLDAHGREVLPRGGNEYTPVTLALPAGQYKVTLRNPKATATQSLSVDARPSGTTSYQAVFSAGSPDEYFARVTQ